MCPKVNSQTNLFYRTMLCTSSSSWKLDNAPVNYANWCQQRYKLTLKIGTETYTVNTAM